MSIMSSRPRSQHTSRSSQSSVPPSTPTLYQLFLQLRARITAQQEPGSFHLEGISPEVGYTVAKNLSEDGDVERVSPQITYNPSVQRFSVTMPTHYHNAIATWVRQEQEEARARGFFTRVESRDMQFMVGSRK